MGKSQTLFRLMCTTGLQTMTEGRNVNNIWGVYFQNDLVWSWDQINNFIGALGVSLIVSGLSAKKMLKYFGLRMFTTFCNWCNITAWIFFSGIGPLKYIDPSTRMWLGLIPGAPGKFLFIRRRIHPRLFLYKLLSDFLIFFKYF